MQIDSATTSGTPEVPFTSYTDIETGATNTGVYAVMPSSHHSEIDSQQYSCGQKKLSCYDMSAADIIPSGKCIVTYNNADYEFTRGDVDNRPPHTYCQIIGCALFLHSGCSATLDQIYKKINETFPWYKLPDQNDWKNKIRHNLCTHKYKLFKRYSVQEFNYDKRVSLWTFFDDSAKEEILKGALKKRRCEHMTDSASGQNTRTIRATTWYPPRAEQITGPSEHIPLPDVESQNSLPAPDFSYQPFTHFNADDWLDELFSMK